MKNSIKMCFLAIHLLESVQVWQCHYKYNLKAYIIIILLNSKCLGFSISDSIYSFWIYILDIMILVNLNPIQFYQLSIKADLADKQSSIAFVDDVSIICEKRYAFIVFRSYNRYIK